MKKLFYFLCILCLYSTSAYSADPQRVSSAIKEVTVYLQGAQVKRTATASLVPGTNELVFEGLSNYVDGNSVIFEGSGDAVILSVGYRINYLKMQDKSSADKQLQNAADTLQAKLTSVQNEKFALNQELAMIQENRKLSPTDKGALIDDIEEAADFYRSRIHEIMNRIARLNLVEAEISSKLNDVNMQIGQSNALSKTPSGELLVKVSSNGYTRSEFTFTYYLANAGWAPIYSLRAQNTTDGVNLDYDANVKQQTGENWKNVKLILSTGDPTLDANKPEFKTWYINFYTSQPYSGYGTYDKLNQAGDYNSGVTVRGSRSAATEYYVDGVKEDAAAPPMQSAADYTTAVKSQLSVRFEINLRYDIPSDGQQHYVRIQQYKLPANFEYIALPKLDKHAFLIAKVAEWEDYNLLPGQANLFFDNAYVGKSFIDPSSAPDTLSLSFGRDDRISIERTKIKESSKKQVLGASKKENFVYVTTIRNAKADPIHITVLEQIPVAQNKEIEVELAETSKGQFKADEGKLSWEMDVPAQETKTLQFEYVVKFPKDRSVGGLYF